MLRRFSRALAVRPIRTFGTALVAVSALTVEGPVAGVLPRWIQGIGSGDGVGEDQETTA